MLQDVLTPIAFKFWRQHLVLQVLQNLDKHSYLQCADVCMYFWSWKSNQAEFAFVWAKYNNFSSSMLICIICYHMDIQLVQKMYFKNNRGKNKYISRRSTPRFQKKMLTYKRHQ